MVENCLLVKTAPEIGLKSKMVEQFFMRKLRENIKLSFKKNGIKGAKLEQAHGRLYIFGKNLAKMQKLMLRVFGVHSVAIAEINETTDLQKVSVFAAKFAKRFLKKGMTFAVRVQRSATVGYSSIDAERAIGQAINDAIPGLKVKLKWPEREIFVELQRDKAFCYVEELACQGGLPVGVEGNVACIFDGSEFDALSAWFMLKRGCSVFPVVAKNQQKAKAALRLLKPWNCFRDFRLTAQADLNKFVSEQKILAIVKADTKIDKAAFEAFDEQIGLPVFRPILFFAEKMLAEKLKILVEK